MSTLSGLPRYNSPFKVPERGLNGIFLRFRVNVELVHRQRGYWTFSGDSESRAYYLGYDTPESVIRYERVESNTKVLDHIKIAWIPGTLDTYGKMRVGNARHHLRYIKEEQRRLGRENKSDFFDVPTYPVDKEGAILQYRVEYNGPHYTPPPEQEASQTAPRAVPEHRQRSSVPSTQAIPASFTRNSLNEARRAVPSVSAFTGPSGTVGQFMQRAGTQQNAPTGLSSSDLSRSPLSYTPRAVRAKDIRPYRSPYQPVPSPVVTSFHTLPSHPNVVLPASNKPNPTKASSFQPPPTFNSSTGTSQQGVYTQGLKRPASDSVAHLNAPPSKRTKTYAPVSASIQTPQQGVYTQRLKRPASDSVTHLSAPPSKRTKTDAPVSASIQPSPMDPQLPAIDPPITTQQEPQTLGRKRTASTIGGDIASAPPKKTRRAISELTPSKLHSDQSTTRDNMVDSALDDDNGAEAVDFDYQSAQETNNASQQSIVPTTREFQRDMPISSEVSLEIPALPANSYMDKPINEVNGLAEEAAEMPGDLVSIQVALPAEPAKYFDFENSVTFPDPFHKAEIDLSNPLVTGSLPCMDCGQEIGHSYTCHIGNIKPLKSPNSLQLRSIADAVDRFDPEPWTEHQGPPPEPEPEDPVEVNRGMAEIIRNDDSYKNDPILHNLPDHALCILWALRQCKKATAEFIFFDGDEPYMWENPPAQEGGEQGLELRGN